MLFSSEQFNGILTLVPVSRVIFTVIRARVNRTYSIGRYRPIVDSSEWTKRGKKKEKKKMMIELHRFSSTYYYFH